MHQGGEWGPSLTTCFLNPVAFPPLAKGMHESSQLPLWAVCSLNHSSLETSRAQDAHRLNLVCRTHSSAWRLQSTSFTACTLAL